MSGFDRIKRPDRRLLEREESQQPDSGQADPEGRAALFSASEQPSTPGAGAMGRMIGKRATPEARSTAPATGRTAGRPTSGRTEPSPADDGRQPGARRAVKADGAPVSPDDPRLPQGRSALHVECGHCGVTCPLPLGHALRQAVPLVVLAPWRSHPVFATCPCGERRAWLKPSVGLPR
ncbi:MAG TPA: hypothetical protein VMM13_10230 [Euzebya sp.]|nr:hypothetical protein [Euzebya sp.]